MTYETGEGRVKIRLFFGELPKVEADFNEWAKSDTILLKDVRIACAVSGLAVPTRGPSLGGSLVPGVSQVAVQVQMIQMFVLMALYQDNPKVEK